MNETAAMARTRYHKFWGGERCDECGARQWFAQDALRYCRNGHRLEGFANHEADEDAFGTQGRVSRKQKEARPKAAVKLTGDEGRELYLEVLQLVLIRQVRWLVDTQGFPAEFADLVKALWTLRVRNLPLRELTLQKEGRRSRGGSASRSRSRGGSDTDAASSSLLFSSQSEASASEADFSDATTVTWAPDARRRWKLPKLIDTLALCYLGCLVRRLPITTGDFYTWIQRDDLEFLSVLNNIPRNVRDRLPPEYHQALYARDHLPAGQLQATVQQLVVAFKVNFDMEMPPLNYVPIIVRFITDLVLPIDVYLVIKCIAKILKTEFAYSSGGKRIQAIDHPEVLLASLVVVSAKLLYPLDGVERPPADLQDPRRTKIDWKEWQTIVAGKSVTKRGGLIRGEEYKVTPDDTLNMGKAGLDDYMDWFEKMWLHDGEPKTPERVRNLFGHTRTSSRPNIPLNSEQNPGDQVNEKYERLSHAISSVRPVTESTEKAKSQPRNLCPIWRTESDLPQAAKVLYGKAAELAAVQLITLIRAAAQVERKVELWCKPKTKKDADAQDKGKGKAKGIGKGKFKASTLVVDSDSDDSWHSHSGEESENPLRN
ncbi:hypothetical protein F4777DRAFT_493012 [Nemania sp. FL0916]|nr:hypothetical protein F4777DRAFT_493012 [Nemania sp. FL0916]